MELGAFGGVTPKKDELYLGIGANGKAKGRLLIPKGFPFAGRSIGSADMELIIGGQTTTSIAPGTSVSKSMREAFKNIDPYLGVMAQGEIPIFKARAWVLIPHIVKTNFRKGAGWDLEIKIIKKLSNWNWADHGVTPVRALCTAKPVHAAADRSGDRRSHRARKRCAASHRFGLAGGGNEQCEDYSKCGNR